MSNQEINREEQKKQTQKLVHRLVMAIDEEPDKFNNYYDLGALLTRLNDFEQAEELFMKALGIFEKKNDAKAVNLLNYGLGNVYYNYIEPALVEAAVRRGEGRLGNGGAFLCTTGQFTGRSPKDKFVVRTPSVENTI